MLLLLYCTSTILIELNCISNESFFYLSGRTDNDNLRTADKHFRKEIQLILFPECKIEVCVGEIANVQRKSSKEPKTIPLMMTLQFGLIGYWTALYLSAFLSIKAILFKTKK